jgi:uncharacterized protein (DUF305 family)
MSRTSTGVPRLAVIVVLSALTLAACDSGPSSRTRNPVGPGAGAGPGAGMGGMGPGMGGMQGMVASEFDYLAKMIPHHDEAIETANILLRVSGRQEMRDFAVTIIETQTAEVVQMKAWLAAWYPGRDTAVRYEPMMRELTALSGDALDQMFLEDMIPHHMMAVMMSQQLINARLAVHAEVNPFAANIRDTQHREIQMMAAWLREWFGVTPPHGGGH